MVFTVLFALITISVIVYGIKEKDKEKRRKNLTVIVIGVGIFLFYLFASNGRYHEIGGYVYLDKWTGHEHVVMEWR
jgi:hypothetical membrane protein